MKVWDMNVTVDDVFVNVFFYIVAHQVPLTG
jgi:hypothetical protein